MAPRTTFFLIVTSFLAYILLIVPQSTSANPIASPTIQLQQAHKNGTCSPDYVWTVIQPISTLGATCCPDGYKGEQTKILGDLAGVFCCPEEGDEVPCEVKEREMPTTPEKCPKPGNLVGALCMNYYW